MRILCCLDGTNAEAVGRAARMFAGDPPPAFGLLTVVDVCPRKDIDRIRERFWRPPMHFVLDHAPCPVLLVRPPGGGLFPIKG